MPAALRSARSQQQSKGLVVLCASYGSQPPEAGYVPSYQPGTPRVADTPHSQPPPPWLDVTVPLQYAVSNGQLVVPSGVRLIHRTGFFDPCPEAQKMLHVEYAYRCGVPAQHHVVAQSGMPHRGQLYCASALDGAGLRLPEDGEVVLDASRLAELVAALPGAT